MRRWAAIIGLIALSWGTAVVARPLIHGVEIDAANTGPSAGGYTALKPADGGEIKDGRSYSFAREIAGAAVYDGTPVNGPHLLIEGAAFSAPLDISVSKPVVFRGVSVRVPAGSPWTILVRPGAGPFYFLWSDAGGQARAAGDKAPASALDLRADHATIYRSHVSGTADGIDISGASIAIKESFIGQLATFPGSHNDAIQLAETAADVTIQRNKILNPNPQTSCLYLLGRDIRVVSNYLAGGGWTIYGGGNNNGHGGGGATNIAVTGNVFGRDYFAKSGHFGPVSYWEKDASHRNVWLNNSFDGGSTVLP